MHIIDASDLPVGALPRVAAAVLAEFGHAYPEWTLAQACLELDNRRGLPRSWFAVADDRVIGCASLMLDDEVEGMADVGPWLGNVWVDEAHRARGVGRALVAAVVVEARRHGCTRLHLVTDSASDWYERQGWIADDEVEVHGHRMRAMHLDL